MLWTDKRISRVKSLLEGGMSAHECAIKLNTTPKALKRALEERSISYKAPKKIDPYVEQEKKDVATKLRSQQKDLIGQLKDERARNALLEYVGKNRPPPRVMPREAKSGIREATGVALASDWHLGEMVTLVGGAGRNQFNLKIAEERAVRFFRAIEWFLAHNRQSFVIRDFILWFGGDFISGYIHEELAETNTLSPNKEVCFAFGLLSDGIRMLLKDPKIERLIIPCSYGNHGRTTAKRRIKTGAQNSFEWLMYTMLAQAFASEKRVQFVIDESAHQYVEAYNYTLHFHHGDEVKFGGGVGGVAIPLMKRVAGWDSVRPAHYHHVGHFHQYLDFGRAVVNGSLIGYSDYAMSIGAKYEEPQQAFYLLDSKRGKTMCAPLWVDGSHVKKEKMAA